MNTNDNEHTVITDALCGTIERTAQLQKVINAIAIYVNADTTTDTRCLAYNQAKDYLKTYAENILDNNLYNFASPVLPNNKPLIFG